ncbi:hypothetical protein [Patulibacter defluvii]|uniref:hypothetical protein n=1 Tax=Patulibacter defluvii TaxID=3095358 RepID=UPI002A75DF25|nr:hypothetical protein [Patulibacter sp. DM4]
MSRRSPAVAVAAAVALAATALPAAADEFDPIALRVQAPTLARADKPLTITVTVSADPGALTSADGPLKLRVKLAPRCGGSFAGTEGPVAIDRRLVPQPDPSRGYRASASGEVSPTAAGEQQVCAFLEAEGDQRQYATDVETTIDVSARCTTAAQKLERDRRALTKSRKRLKTQRRQLSRAKHRATRQRLQRRVRTTRRTVARRQRIVRRDTTAARDTCPGLTV